MLAPTNLKKRLVQVFNEDQAELLAEVIHDAYSDLVKTSDFNELKEIVRELAQAQQRTELRVEELAQSQQRLVEAQERTERSLQKLADEHRETRRQVGGLATTVGYRLEDEAYKGLPALLLADHGLTVQDRLKRSYLEDSKGNMLEVNIIGRATDENGRLVHIIGESKSQLSQNDVDRFLRRKLKPLEGVYDPIFPVLVTYMTAAPDVEAYTENKGIALYYSYEF